MKDREKTTNRSAAIPWAKRWDWLAEKVIRLGGLGILLSMLLLVIFLGKEALPLFSSPTWSLKKADLVSAHRLLGVDPLTSLTVSVDPYGTVVVEPRNDQGLASSHPLPWTQWPMDEKPKQLSALQSLSADGFAALLFEPGLLVPLRVTFNEEFDTGRRKISTKVNFLTPVFLPQSPDAWSMSQSEEGALFLVWRKNQKIYRQQFDEDRQSWTSAVPMDLTGTGPLMVSGHGDLVIVGLKDGLGYQTKNQPVQKLLLKARPTALKFLLGGSLLAVGTDQGQVHTLYWLRAVLKNEKTKSNQSEKVLVPETASLMAGAKKGLWSIEPAGYRFFPVNRFPAGKGAVISLASSARNKGFLSLTDQQELAFHFATTGRTDLSAKLQGEFSALGFFPKDDGLWVDGPMPVFATMDQKHPDVTLSNLFLPVHYDGYGQPEQVWQSTGGSDEFEPKFGLWPLVFGTLKGTLYALLISLPLAITGALYLSQLAPAKLKNTFKPAVEFMAALPSVVVGLLAALWLAPIMEEALTAVFCWILLLPMFVTLLFAAFRRLPLAWRQKSRYPEMALVPGAILGATFCSWVLAGPVESVFFKGSLSQWLYTSLNVSYDQRNCIVVGIALGFAVMPIIFTVCEDAFSAVPGNLTSAALALGANRWQAALKVVVPAASPGIFAAVMLGLGRAVGETMIVLMATGNTPIMEWSPFNGMRTMSAAIAVEIPEAPVDSSLYRILFLAGILLFALTFLINSIAELVGSRLRKKYARF